MLTLLLISNLPYLALEDEDDDWGNPTMLQQLAFETLTYTYPLLPILVHLPSVSTSFSSALSAISRRSPEVTNRRRAYGLENHARNELRYTFAVPRFVYNVLLALSLVLRHPTRLLIPISLIMVRAAFIMYIFGWTPRKNTPWFVAVSVWMCWEIWGIIKVEGARIRAEAPGNNPPPPPHAQPAARRPDGLAPPPAQNGNAQPGAGQGQQPVANGHAAPQPNGPLPAPNPVPEDILTRMGMGPGDGIASFPAILAMFKLQSQWEQLGLDPVPSTTGDPVAPPVLGPAAVDPRKLTDTPLGSKAVQFCVLFVWTLLPEVWARRVRLLRIREGKIREVYGREWIIPGPPGEELTPEETERRRVFADRQALLTGWRRTYVRRVLGGMGQDDDM